jgi:hypothetical protein
MFSSRPATAVNLKHFAMSATHRLSTTGGDRRLVQTPISGSLAMGRTFRIKLRFRRFARRHPWLTFTFRSFMIFSVVFGGAYGFIAGAKTENSGYDPHAFAIGVAFLFAIACVALATFSVRLRLMRKKMRKVALHNEALADRNWELQEAEQRARRLFESQGDLIVLRDVESRLPMPTMPIASSHRCRARR